MGTTWGKVTAKKGFTRKGRAGKGDWERRGREISAGNTQDAKGRDLGRIIL